MSIVHDFTSSIKPSRSVAAYAIVKSKMPANIAFLVGLQMVASLLTFLVVDVRLLWRWRKPIIGFTVPLYTFVAASLLASLPNLATILLFLILVTLVINAMRIVHGRMNEVYLKKVARRTAHILIGWQILTLLGWWLQESYFHISWHVGLQFLVLSGFYAAIIIIWTTANNFVNTRLPESSEPLSDKELPTVTVAVPARNETEDLVPCIEAILASDYPKLEVLVLDDCSRDKTPIIIKGFAHDGVRFVAGDEPRDKWLAKNQAYEKLTAEASGTYIIFAGVDTRFSPHTIRELVQCIKQQELSMLSVLPHRQTMQPWSAFIQPMRYWWELAVPRSVFGRPAVLSTCWLIDRKVIKKLGGFAAVSHKVLPEAYFAQKLAETNSYKFIRTSQSMALMTLKTGYEQRQTAIRTRYPQMHRRPENVLLVALAELGLLLTPFALLGVSFFRDLGNLQPLLYVTCLLLVISHVLITLMSNERMWIWSLMSFPFVVLAELWLLIDSMLQYEFGQVEWKERNICLPVMHVVPKLPDL